VLEGNQTFTQLSVLYGLHKNIIAHGQQSRSIDTNPRIQANLSEAFVGAVAPSWLDELFRPLIRPVTEILRKAYYNPTLSPVVDSKGSSNFLTVDLLKEEGHATDHPLLISGQVKSS
jgi:hypothetical protein